MGGMRCASAIGHALAGFLFAPGMAGASGPLILEAGPLIAPASIATLPKLIGHEHDNEGCETSACCISGLQP
jgi:hypothetical protein